MMVGPLEFCVETSRVADILAQINQIHRDDVECKLNFAGFLVFHCPLKPDAVEILKMLNDSSHRVCLLTNC